MPRDRSEMPALTAELARWLAGLGSQALPESARHAARLALLDTMGAALHGRREFWAETALAWARQGYGPAGDGQGLATIWGEPQPALRPADAALVNGVAAHAFELDDFIAKLHPGAAVVPAALALAERLGSGGEAIETAVIAGYEVMVRASLALDPNAARLRGWHLTGVCGPLGAAAAGAVLLGLDEEAAAWALGLGATQGSGLFAFNADGAMSKRLHPGRAAHAGVMAAELAAMGFTGPASVLETDDGGFLDAFSDAAKPERLLDGLGSDWAVEQVYFKPYSCCGSLHAYVDAARALRARLGRMPAADETVRAGLPRVVDVQCGFDYEPGTALNGQMSARFTIAAALADGNALPAQYTDERLKDPELVELARRIELVPDAELDNIYPADYPGWVEIARPDGRLERSETLNPSGAPGHPGREAALLSKYDALAADAVGEAAAGRLKAVLMALPRHDAAALAAAPAAAA